jgi:hypothetical protein
MSLVFEVFIIILYVLEFSPFYSKLNFIKEYSVNSFFFLVGKKLPK